MASALDALTSRLLQTRSVVRAPIWLYQHRLGWLLGRRVLMLEHLGRTSGLPRFVCLEIVERPTPDTIVVVSGFGRHAQWYRNLQAHQACYVSVGARYRIAARARCMSDSESAAALGRYERAHPRAWRHLRGAIEHAIGHPVDGLPMVELTMVLEPGSAEER